MLVFRNLLACSLEINTKTTMDMFHTRLVQWPKVEHQAPSPAENPISCKTCDFGMYPTIPSSPTYRTSKSVGRSRRCWSLMGLRSPYLPAYTSVLEAYAKLGDLPGAERAFRGWGGVGGWVFPSHFLFGSLRWRPFSRELQHLKGKSKDLLV